MDVDHQTTAPVLFCAATISIPTRRMEAKDWWDGILLAELVVVVVELPQTPDDDLIRARATRGRRTS